MRYARMCVLLLISILIVHCGGEKKEQTQPGANTPPVINEVTLLPEKPSVKSEINVHILSSDKEGDPITYRVQWFVNGTKIGEGMAFSYSDAKRGDKIYAEATPFDGKTWGESVQSQEITVGGTPPRIISVQIAPESVFVTTPQVVVTAMVEDPDKDSIQLFVHWIVKDQVISDTSNTLSIKKFKLKKHDVISGSAFAYDREFKSEPFLFEFAVMNAPPTFRTKIDSIKCNPDNINYTLPIFDPDGDPVTFQLVEAPPGLVIDAKKGVVSGSAGDVKLFDIIVRATDSEGDYLEAKFTLTSP